MPLIDFFRKDVTVNSDANLCMTVCARNCGGTCRIWAGHDIVIEATAHRCAKCKHEWGP